MVDTLSATCRNSSKGKKKAELRRVVSSMYWGESNAMKQLRTLIEKVAQTDANILITGENGDRKEMLAREIHALSERCRAQYGNGGYGRVTESLFESELFGHVKVRSPTPIPTGKENSKRLMKVLSFWTK